MLRITRAGKLAASAAAVVALATACGSSGTSSSKSTPAPSPSAASTQAPSTTAPASPASPALEVANNATLGQIVTDGSGFTLYRFDHDTANPSMSNCTGSCATLWPPALAPAQITSTGLNSSQIGTVTRSDGTKQLTLAGWPLYRYSPDTKAGDIKGEGFGGIWFASTPAGGKAMAKSSSTPATPSTPAPAKPTPTPMAPSTPSTGGGGGGGYGY